MVLEGRNERQVRPKQKEGKLIIRMCCCLGHCPGQPELAPVKLHFKVSIVGRGKQALIYNLSSATGHKWPSGLTPYVLSCSYGNAMVWHAVCDIREATGQAWEDKMHAEGRHCQTEGS